MHQQQGRDKEQRIAPPGVAAQGKAQKERGVYEDDDQHREIVPQMPEHDPGGDRPQRVGGVVDAEGKAKQQGQCHQSGGPDCPQVFFHTLSSSQRS